MKEMQTRNRLKILMLSTYIYPPYVGGAEMHAYYVANKLAENGNHVHVFSTDSRKPVTYQTKIMFKLSLFKLLPRPLGILHFICKTTVFAFLLRREFDLIQVHIAGALMIPAFVFSKITRKPYVVTCHGSEIRILS